MTLNETNPLSNLSDYFFRYNFTYVDDEDDGCAECYYFSLENASALIRTITHAVNPNTASWRQYPQVLKTYMTLLVIILGSLGNTISLFVFTVGPLRKQVISVYLSILSVSDTVVLLTQLVYVLQRLLPSFSWSQPYCSITAYLAYASSFLSVWILVLFTIERYIAVCHPMRTEWLLSRGKAWVAMLCLGCVSLLLYLFIPFTRETNNINMGGGIRKYTCVANSQYKYVMNWIEVADAFLTSIVPCVLIVTLNSFMMKSLFSPNKQLHDSQHSAQRLTNTSDSGDQQKKVASISKRRVAKTSKLLIVISSTFVVLNLPYAIIKTRVIILEAMGELIKQETVAWVIAGCTSHYIFMWNFAVNFILYNWCSEAFRKALKDSLCFKYNTGGSSLKARLTKHSSNTKT